MNNDILNKSTDSTPGWYPDILPCRAAQDAGAGFTRPDGIPYNSAGRGNASYKIGFPPETGATIQQGGLPPRGGDFNRFFFDMSSLLAYQQIGGVITWDERVGQAQINPDLPAGYPQDAIVAWYDDSSGLAGRGTLYFIRSRDNNNTVKPTRAPGVTPTVGESTTTAWILCFPAFADLRGVTGSYANINLDNVTGTVNKWINMPTGTTSIVAGDAVVDYGQFINPASSGTPRIIFQGYRRWASGMIDNWGKYLLDSSSGSTHTISFLTPYSSDRVSVSCNYCLGGTGIAQKDIFVNLISSSNFTVRSSSTTANAFYSWSATGY